MHATGWCPTVYTADQQGACISPATCLSILFNNMKAGVSPATADSNFIQATSNRGFYHGNVGCQQQTVKQKPQPQLS